MGQEKYPPQSLTFICIKMMKNTRTIINYQSKISRLFTFLDNPFRTGTPGSVKHFQSFKDNLTTVNLHLKLLLHAILSNNGYKISTGVKKSKGDGLLGDLLQIWRRRIQFLVIALKNREDGYLQHKEV